MSKEVRKFRILSLDGGGAKGMYTIGALQALEDLLDNGPLYKSFDLVYGTSTGAIIGSLIGLGWKVEKIRDEYRRVIPKAFQPKTDKLRSEKLRIEAERLFGTKKFDSFLTNVGIVSTNVDFERPTIFKTDINLTYSGKASFEAGFGADISTAVRASSAAVPYLDSVFFKSEMDGLVHLIDGGFVANNPSLFALVDAVGALKLEQPQIQLVSFGTGKFSEIEPPTGLKAKVGKFLVDHYMPTNIFSKSLSASAEATDRIVQFGFPEVKRFRLSASEPSSDFQTHLLETNMNKLDHMYAFGRRSFGDNEKNFLAIWS